MTRSALRVLTHVLLGAGLLVLPATAFADKVIWQYDDLPGDMVELANGLKSHPHYVQPGFVAGEAFGQLYRPKATDYPVKILSVELVMAQPDNAAPGQKLSASIEFWNDPGDGPAPKASAPLWSINTDDFSQPGGGAIGVPIVGNTGMVYQFDWSKPDNHPPLITQGNIWVMVRIKDKAADTSTYWGKAECGIISIPGLGSAGCGCQKLAAVLDTGVTKKANVLHIVWDDTGMGNLDCSGAPKWYFAEQLNNAMTGAAFQGDFVLRMGVEGTAAIVTPDAGSTADTSAPDAGSTPDAGVVDVGSAPDVPADTGPLDTTSVMDVPPPDSGPDVDSGPDMDSGPDVDSGPPAQVDAGKPAPSIDYLTPSQIPANQATSVEIGGKGFQAGATVKLMSSVGNDTLANVTVSADGTTITGTVAGFAAGVYDVKVSNPDGQSAFKGGVLTITAPANLDATGTSTDAGVTSTGGTKASGCTAGPVSHGSGIFGLLLGLCALLVRRRLRSAS
jgi:hypothetical protein